MSGAHAHFSGTFGPRFIVSIAVLLFFIGTTALLRQPVPKAAAAVTVSAPPQNR
jgi:hypothetical protein